MSTSNPVENVVSRYSCTICGTPLPADFDPQPCCDGRECGCMGQPTNPLVCSDACYNKLPLFAMKEGAK